MLDVKTDRYGTMLQEQKTHSTQFNLAKIGTRYRATLHFKNELQNEMIMNKKTIEKIGWNIYFNKKKSILLKYFFYCKSSTLLILLGSMSCHHHLFNTIQCWLLMLAYAVARIYKKKMR